MTLQGQIKPISLQGSINVVPNEGGAGGPLQSKTVYPSHEEQIITPDEDFYGLSLVKVKPVPREPICKVELAVDTLFKGEIDIPVSVPQISFEVTAEHYYPYALYNGVRLPRIPEDVLKNYPYAWIRKNTTIGYYDLLLSDKPFYYGSPPGIYYESNKATGEPWYRVPISGAENATEWQNNTSANTYSSWGLDSARTVLWSNHDIPSGSATATEIYFAGTDPVLTD